MIQDIAPHQLINHYDPAKKPKEESVIFSFRKRGVLVKEEDGHFEFPLYKDMEKDHEYIYLLTLDDTDIFMVKHPIQMSGYYYEDVWNLRRDDEEFKPMLLAVVTGYQLSNWYRKNRFCGYCGCQTQLDTKERAITCPNCGQIIYPRLNPAVIVGVINGDSILITKYAKGFSQNALIAGFTEIGETMEQTVEREVMEEAGIKVKNITYYKSQPWGFADDILMGFFCELDGDPTIKMDRSELKKAVWTPREEIVLQSNHLSLTNEMMEMFKNGQIDRSYLKNNI